MSAFNHVIVDFIGLVTYLILVTMASSDLIRSDRIRQEGTGSDQFGSDQTEVDRIRPDGTRSPPVSGSFFFCSSSDTVCGVSHLDLFS